MDGPCQWEPTVVGSTKWSLPQLKIWIIEGKLVFGNLNSIDFLQILDISNIQGDGVSKPLVPTGN